MEGISASLSDEDLKAAVHKFQGRVARCHRLPYDGAVMLQFGLENEAFLAAASLSRLRLIELPPQLASH